MAGSLTSLLTPDNLVFLAAAIQAAALLFRGQTKIRVFLLLGSIVYLLYYMTVATEPLWEAMIATAAMAVANVYGLCALLLGNTVRLIPASQMPIYTMFGSVAPGEFRALMRHSSVYRTEQDAVLTELGEVPQSLYFIIDGELEICQGVGQFRIPSKHFIGEVSLMLGTPASATVYLKAGAHVVEWPRDRLIREMTRYPKLKIALESLLGQDMARKVAVGAGRIDAKYVNYEPKVACLY